MPLKNIYVYSYQDQVAALERANDIGLIAPIVILTDKYVAPEYSYGDIVKQIRQSKEPVNLVCFGKAASDCLAGLLAFRNLQFKVVEFLSLEGKVRGAEFAENAVPPLQTLDVQKAEKMPFLEAFSFIFTSLRSLVRGHRPGVYAMHPSRRKSYLDLNKSSLVNLSRTVNLLSLDSSSKKYGVLPHSKVIKLSQLEKN